MDIQGKIEMAKIRLLEADNILLSASNKYEKALRYYNSLCDEKDKTV